MKFESSLSAEEAADETPQPEQETTPESPVPALEDPVQIIEAAANIIAGKGKIAPQPTPEEEPAERPRIKKMGAAEVRERLISAVEGIIQVDWLDRKSEDQFLIGGIVYKLVRKAIEGKLDMTTMEELEDLWYSEEFLREVIQQYSQREAERYVIRKIKKEEMTISDEEASIPSKIYEVLGLSPEQGKDITHCCASICGSGKNTQEKGEKGGKGIKRTLDAILDIELEAPGAASKLYYDYGIRHFYRYQADDLIRQLENQIKRPLRVALTATSDWNGALTDIQNRLSHFDREHGRVFVEASSPIEITHRLIALSTKYGPIADLVIGAHGQREGMRFGIERRHSISQNDSRWLKNLGRLMDEGIFSEDVEITLFSCNTGRRGGIAKTLAESIGTKRGHVRAPRVAPSGLPYTDKKGRIFYRTDDPIGPDKIGKFKRPDRKKMRRSKAARF